MAERLIYKYVVRATSVQSIDLPKGAKVLKLDVQDNQVVFWAEVDPIAPAVSRMITVAPTGGRVPFGDYIGTFALHGYVGHVYLESELPDA